MEINQITTAPIGNDSSLKSKWKAFYNKYEKYSELAIFGVGFIWDSITMTRVDNPVDHAILLFYLALIGYMIFLLLRNQCGEPAPKLLRKIEPKFRWIMQFCFGGIFSSFVIFYFKSASWSKTQFFFLLLVGLWIGNEFLDHRLQNRDLLAILYSFSVFSFMAFFLPVLLASVNPWIFVLAGVISLVASLLLFYAGMSPDRENRRRKMIPVAAWIGGVFLTLNLLYFANLIPPVPLALKTGRIYHSVKRAPDGKYEAQYVAPPFWEFWKKGDDPFFFSKGERVYCYSAVFAPRKLRIPIIHAWSCRTINGWKVTDRIRIQIAGGREGGYRGYTSKQGITPGEWRVEIETERGQTLGRISFTVLDSPDPHPPLKTEILE